MSHFAEALTLLRDRATDMFGMGRSFERLMQSALLREPVIWGQRFTQVWMWDEWPGRDGQDAGIDPGGRGTGRRPVCHPVQIL